MLWPLHFHQGCYPSTVHCACCVGGGFFKKIRTGMRKVEFKISTISISRKAWFCDPSLYHFVCKKHPIWCKLGAFLAKFSKIHPILQIGRIRYVTITHPSIYQNLRKCTSNLWASPYTICQWEPPPPPGVAFGSAISFCKNLSPAGNLLLPKSATENEFVQKLAKLTE